MQGLSRGSVEARHRGQHRVEEDQVGLARKYFSDVVQIGVRQLGCADIDLSHSIAWLVLLGT